LNSFLDFIFQFLSINPSKFINSDTSHSPYWLSPIILIELSSNIKAVCNPPHATAYTGTHSGSKYSHYHFISVNPTCLTCPSPYTITVCFHPHATYIAYIEFVKWSSNSRIALHPNIFTWPFVNRIAVWNCPQAICLTLPYFSYIEIKFWLLTCPLLLSPNKVTVLSDYKIAEWKAPHEIWIAFLFLHVSFIEICPLLLLPNNVNDPSEYIRPVCLNPQSTNIICFDLFISDLSHWPYLLSPENIIVPSYYNIADYL